MTALRRGLAVVAGFAIVGIMSVAADAGMQAVGVFPPPPQIMSDAMFVVPAVYRAVFTVLGGWVATKAAGDGSFLAAKVLSGFGLAAGLAGVAVWFSAAGTLGPLWYALSIPVSAIPCTMAGAWLALRRKN